MLKRSEAWMGRTHRTSHSGLARASANMPYKIEKSVFDFVTLRRPLLEGLQRSVAHEVLAKDVTLGVVEFELVIDEGVVEVDTLGVFLGVAIADTAHTRPIEGRKAHGARLARGVDGAPLQLKCAQLLTGIADRRHLGMSRGIVIGHHAVGTRGML